jgi:hypothetical protein
MVWCDSWFFWLALILRGAGCKALAWQGQWLDKLHSSPSR